MSLSTCLAAFVDTITLLCVSLLLLVSTGDREFTEHVVLYAGTPQEEASHRGSWPHGNLSPESRVY